LSIEYFFKGYSLKYARSGFENHFLPGKEGFGRAKIASLPKAGEAYLL